MLLSNSKDRLTTLLGSAERNGIAFVEVDKADERILRVHFLNAVDLQSHATTAAISGGETIPIIAVSPIAAADWTADAEGRPLLTLTAAIPGDFSIYTLTLGNDALDPFFRTTRFSFKANCPSDLDCELPPPDCPTLSENPPPIDYLAKDFLSFRQALLNFSALRYPEWQERSEADFGVMFAEALSSLADDLSYQQDRIAAEAYLDTATQRRSLVRLARLVDYEPAPALAASVLLQLDVLTHSLPSGLAFQSLTPDGQPIIFEIGSGLLDPNTGRINDAAIAVNPNWNSGIKPYFWDDSQQCLPAGATEMWVQGWGYAFESGMLLLIDTPAESSADAPTRELVTLSRSQEETDPLFMDSGGQPLQTTHLFWEKPLRRDHPLFWTAAQAAQHDGDFIRTTLAGNLVPATHGQRVTEQFAIEPSGTSLPSALVREGPNDRPDAPSVQFLFPLQKAPLTWLLRPDPDSTQEAAPLPEIALKQTDTADPPDWRWRRSLLDALPFETAFTVEPARYRRIAVNSDQTVQYDYDGDDGETIRFGILSELPGAGAVFQATYRTGGGAIGNTARDTITGTGAKAAGLVSRVTNPFAAVGGADAETSEQVRRRAPQAFRAKQFRAVRAEDYERAAETLPWVEKAGTRFRWTGSWLTVFTTADPQGSETLSLSEQVELIDLLNRYRMAGYESYAPAPRYLGLDLRITVCVRPEAFRGDAEAAIASALSSRTGFFALDRFTFGTPLERRELEAALQNAYGVAGVLSITYRRRGVTQGFQDLPDVLTVGSNEILRVDNDFSRPDRGTFQIIVEGGK